LSGGHVVLDKPPAAHPPTRFPLYASGDHSLRRLHITSQRLPAPARQGGCPEGPRRPPADASGNPACYVQSRLSPLVHRPPKAAASDKDAPPFGGHQRDLKRRLPSELDQAPVGGVTTTLALSLFPSPETRMTACPGLSPLTNPIPLLGDSTDAISGLEEDQVTGGT
jgi:hypothetical protein